MFKKVIFMIIVSCLSSTLYAQTIDMPAPDSAKDTLVVLWASGDPEVAEKVCLMYTHAAKKYGWFDRVILIVWGPSANLLAQDRALQKKIKSMIADGVQLEACVACANSYDISDNLRALGINVIGMGKPLTKYLKEGYSTLTF